MLNLGRLLQWCAFFLCACLAVQAASAQSSSGSPVTNTLLAVDAERSSPRVPDPLVPIPLVPDPLLPERWGALEPHLDVCFVVPEGLAKGWKPQRLVVHEPSASGKGGRR